MNKKFIWGLAVIGLFGLSQPTNLQAVSEEGLIDEKIGETVESSEMITDAMNRVEKNLLTTELTDTTESSEETVENSDSTDNSQTTNSSEETKTSSIGETTTSSSEEPENILEKTGLSEFPTVAEIRAALTSEYITQEELASFSDQQLLNSMTVFRRYNHDIIGMDLSSYVGVLRALYKDNTLSWDLIAEQLNFNIKNFSTPDDVLSQLPQLQNYLRTLYPANSSFIAIRNLSDQELTDIIHYMTRVENERELASGRIGFIIQCVERGIPKDEEVVSSSEKEAATSVADKGTKLPQMSEQNSTISVFVGVILLVAATMFFYFKRSKQNFN